MNLPIGRKAELSDRMETELAAWLHGFEPAGTPIAFRLRTFADLRTEAERPRRRLSRLMPALSSAASLSAVVVGLALILVLAVMGASLGQGTGSAVQPYPGGPVQPPEVGGPAGPGDLAAVLALIALSCLAGGTVLLRPVRAAASRLAFGGGGAEPAAPLPLRRPWRSIPRLTWLLAALTVVAVVLGVRLTMTAEPPPTELFKLVSFLSVCSQLVAAPLALVVAWRYPRRDRSSRLVFLYAVTSLTFLLWYYAGGSLGMGRWLWPGPMWLLAVLGAGATISLVAGLAGRWGSVPRPPLRVAAIGVGGTFFLVAYNWIDLLVYLGPLPSLDYLATIAEGWIAAVAALAITWIGLSACRRGGSRAWWLVLAAGALRASNLLVGALGFGAVVATQAVGDQSIRPEDLPWIWTVLATTLSSAALLAALLIGLRPLPPDGAEEANPPEPAE